jgi:hypothetical protein
VSAVQYLIKKSIVEVEVKKKWSYPCNRPWRPIGLWDVKDFTHVWIISSQTTVRLSALSTSHALFLSFFLNQNPHLLLLDFSIYNFIMSSCRLMNNLTAIRNIQTLSTSKRLLFICTVGKVVQIVGIQLTEFSLWSLQQLSGTLFFQSKDEVTPQHFSCNETTTYYQRYCTHLIHDRPDWKSNYSIVNIWKR